MNKILLVEDDQVLAKMCSSHLRAQGFDAVIAQDGQEAIDLLEQIQPHLVVLDLMIPKITGLDVLKHIRSKATKEKLPVIVFSNAYLTSMVQAAWRAGANRCLTKADCSPVALVEVIRKTLSSSAPSVSPSAPDATVAPVPVSPVPVAAPVASASLPKQIPGNLDAPKKGPPMQTSGASPILPSTGARQIMGTGMSTPASLAPASDPKAASTASSTAAVKPAPEASPTSAPKPVPEMAITRELRQYFLDGLTQNLETLDQLYCSLASASDASQQAQYAGELFKRMRSLTGNAAFSEVPIIAKYSAAMEALLKEIQSKPQYWNLSTQTTLCRGLEFLTVLAGHVQRTQAYNDQPARVMVVDDDDVSRRLATLALEQAGLQCDNAEDALRALNRICSNDYQLFILDINMPGMSGLELCQRLRSTDLHKETAVVFVTSQDDFEKRSQSAMLGATDFIAKPFLPVELAVKALGYVLQHQIERNLVR